LDKKELQKKIGARIKQIRISKGISQQDLAALCNMEKSNFSRLEAGGTNPTIHTLYTIAQNLSIELKEILLISSTKS
jgi:transcriptional regulator with XRE-family HTH domain|tara:strand:+ start:1153 stop:1383 length:231 start_codon:yes stop_codon:yes gene_type:complete